jgi:hypothetical protein
MVVDLSLFLPLSELIGCPWVVGGLRGNTAEGYSRVPVLVLEDVAILLLLHAVSGRQDAVPVVIITQFNVWLPEEAFLPKDFLEQLMCFGLGLLTILVKLLTVFLQLDYPARTLTTKLLMRRLYFSISAGRILLWYLLLHFLSRLTRYSVLSASALCFRKMWELYMRF